MPPVGAPRETVAADREHRGRERTRIVHATAVVIATHGYGATTMTRVQNETGLARDQLYRLFPNRTRLLTEVYRRGHHRAAAQCISVSSPKHVATFTRAAVRQAQSDPIVAAMHALEMSPTATASGLPSIYRIWEQWLTTTLDTRTRSHASIDNEDGGHAVPSADLAGVLVDALAGTIVTARRLDSHTAGHSVDLILRTYGALLSE